MASRLLSALQAHRVGVAQKANAMPTARLQTASALMIALLFVTGTPSRSADCRADELACRCRDAVCCCVRKSATNGWQVVESRSFRIHHVGQPAVAERLAPLCERTRQSLRERWLGETNTTAWSLKCDLFLYPSGKEFQRLTRFPDDTWGFADLEIGNQRVSMRRLHLRTDDAARVEMVLIHELTHVVLADYFAEHQIPRWADEGIAVLSEPSDRRQKQREWLKQEATQGRLFSLRQLTEQRAVPNDKRLGDLFYAQSAALVEFLIAERDLSESDMLRFVADSQTRGLSETIGRWFPDSVATNWDSEWRDWLLVARRDVQVASTTKPKAEISQTDLAD